MSVSSHGLLCPRCQSVVPVPEGIRIVQCQNCDMRSYVQGDKGTRRWQVNNRVQRASAMDSVTRFFSGMNRASDLKKNADIKEMFLVYLPYWRVRAHLAGWIFGRVKSGKDSTRPIEVEIFEEMHWNDAATDVSEFGVHQVKVPHGELEPYDSDLLHGEAMVFEPTESFSDAEEEARMHFEHRARSKRSLKSRFFEKYHLLRRQLGIIYYPLWVARYEYRERNYQVVVDGVSGRVLYGKAPGNIMYRSAALVGAMALGNLILVNGTLIAGRLLLFAEDIDEAALFVLAPIAAGIAIIVGGYRAFRYGEEVEETDRSAKKAIGTGKSDGSRFSLPSGLEVLNDVMDNDFDLEKILR